MTNLKEKYEQFIGAFGGSVKKSESLSAYTTFGTGGEADLLLHAHSIDELSQAVKLANEYALPYFVIGEGSNLLVSDNGYNGLIIRNSIRSREVKDNELIIGAGENLDSIVDFATDSSLTGLEFAAGIWGSVGGAIYGNAGAFGSQIGSVLKSAQLVDKNGHVREERNDYFQFAYRDSYLKRTHEIVGIVTFELSTGVQTKISKRVNEIRDVRSARHPETPCSAGCFFKNIEDASQPYGKIAAGKLLEDVGAKSITVGGAGVFPEHANILVNNGKATSKDIRYLADTLKKKVKEKFNLDLIEEVICLGNFETKEVE